VKPEVPLPTSSTKAAAAKTAARRVAVPGAAPAAVTRFFEFALLGMLGAGFLAIFGSGALEWPTAVIGALALVIRGLMAAGVIRLEVPPRVVLALALGYIGFFPLDFYYVSGSFLIATVHMVFFLAVLKLVTAKTPRDYGYLKVIAGLELVAAAIMTASALFLVYLAVFLCFAIATFASSEVRRASEAQQSAVSAVPAVAGEPKDLPAKDSAAKAAAAKLVVSRAGMRAFSRRLGTLSGFLFAGILIMTVALFFILPRTARAAFDRFIPQRFHITGFSNSVTLGQLGELKQNNTPLMHVRSYQGEGFLPVKWRGTALADFDGRAWSNPTGEERLVRNESGLVAVRTAVQGKRQGRNLIYQVQLDRSIADTLFFAGNPETISINVPILRYARNGTFRVPPRFGTRGLGYSVYAFLPDEWAEVRFTASPLPDATREQLLKLPTLDARIPELARDMTRGAESEVQKARAIENHLRHDYGYTLNLLSKEVDDPLAYFLFERKKGHCEYFASAMTVMLRSQGIPARVVTGFQSGVFNPMTGWQVIRASDAHSWVEAWLEGRGWTTFDPTPSDPNAAAPGLMSRLALFSDAVEQYWQDWVMGYDLNHQVALASRMQESSRRFKMPSFDGMVDGFTKAGQMAARSAIPVGVALVLIAAGIVLGPRVRKLWSARVQKQRLQRGETNPSDATILYQQLLALLARRGIQKPPWLTPNEFARAIPGTEIGTLVGDATAAYNELRFGGNRDAAPRMMHVLERIEKLPSF
jgi:uncharacterized membrane protein